MIEGRYKQEKQQQRESALQRIRALFDAAALVFAKNREQARRLVEQAHRLMMRAKVKLPVALKRRYCKKCHSLWQPGSSVRVRLSKGKVVYTCLSCKRIWRLPLLSAGSASGNPKRKV